MAFKVLEQRKISTCLPSLTISLPMSKGTVENHSADLIGSFTFQDAFFHCLFWLFFFSKTEKQLHLRLLILILRLR